MKKVLIVALMLFGIMFYPACKGTPTTPEPPTKTQDVVEFMYERALPIVDNGAPDPNGFTIWSDEFGGKWTKGNMTYLGNDQWMGEVSLFYSTAPYWVYTIDYKVIFDVAVAETIYARIKGSSEWIRLTCIENHSQMEGKWTKFYLDDKGIRVP